MTGSVLSRNAGAIVAPLQACTHVRQPLDETANVASPPTFDTQARIAYGYLEL